MMLDIVRHYFLGYVEEASEMLLVLDQEDLMSRPQA
jgi:hypothetical protein